MMKLQEVANQQSIGHQSMGGQPLMGLQSMGAGLQSRGSGGGNGVGGIMNEQMFQQREQFINRRNDDAPFFFDSRGSNQFMNGPPHHQRHPRQQYSPHSQFDHDNRRFSMDSYGPIQPPRGFMNNRNSGGPGDRRFRGNINPWAI